MFRIGLSVPATVVNSTHGSVLRILRCTKGKKNRGGASDVTGAKRVGVTPNSHPSDFAEITLIISVCFHTFSNCPIQ